MSAEVLIWEVSDCPISQLGTLENLEACPYAPSYHLHKVGGFEKDLPSDTDDDEQPELQVPPPGASLTLLFSGSRV